MRVIGKVIIGDRLLNPRITFSYLLFSTWSAARTRNM